jgi:hypothetical protein
MVGKSGERDGSRTRLDGWKAIAAYAGRSERALQRWALQRGFPVHRVGGTGSVFAWTDEVDHWFSTTGRSTFDGQEPALSDPGYPPLPHDPVPGQPAPPPVPHTHSSSLFASLSRSPQFLFAVFVVAALGSAFTVVALRLMGGSWQSASDPIPRRSDTPCHLVEWPTTPLPSRGGRLKLAVRPRDQVCASWVPPYVSQGWLLVVPPSALSALPRVMLSPNHPLAMPTYDPSARQLFLEFAGNPRPVQRTATIVYGAQTIQIVQEPGGADCTVPPGPGFVANGWRFLIGRKKYPPETDFLAAVRRDETADAAPVSWPDVLDLLDGKEDVGTRFADETGIARQSWEESLASSDCFDVWLSGESQPRFITYFMGRLRLSYDELGQVNHDQFDLGTWRHSVQVLYRVPLSSTGAASGGPSGER